MDIHIHIEKRHLFVFSAVIGILIGVLVVAAFDSNPGWNPTAPSNFGHSVDEIDWSQAIKSDVKISEKRLLIYPSATDMQPLSIGDKGNPNPNEVGIYSGLDSSLAKKDLKITTGSPGTDNGNLIYLTGANNGRVGIGTNTPTVKLDVEGQIKSHLGGFVFPDATVQTTSAQAGGRVVGGGVERWTANILDDCFDQWGQATCPVSNILTCPAQSTKQKLGQSYYDNSLRYYYYICVTN